MQNEDSRSTAPVLIVVTGAPATGKTVIARRVAKALQLPLVCKDDLKELLFDDLGWSDQAWSRRTGAASFNLIFYFAECIIGAGGSTVIEANFKREMGHEARFKNLQARTPFQPIQIRCRAESHVILSRFKARVETGERHPGHVDQFNADALLSNIERGIYRIDIGGSVYEVDTTDFAAFDYQGLCDTIRVHLPDRT